MSYLSKSRKESKPAFVIVRDTWSCWLFVEVPIQFRRQMTRIYDPGSSDPSAGSAVGPRRVKSRNRSSETIRTQSFGTFGMGITGPGAQERAKITPQMRYRLWCRDQDPLPSSPFPGALNQEIEPSRGSEGSCAPLDIDTAQHGW